MKKWIALEVLAALLAGGGVMAAVEGGRILFEPKRGINYLCNMKGLSWLN